MAKWMTKKEKSKGLMSENENIHSCLRENRKVMWQKFLFVSLSFNVILKRKKHKLFFIQILCALIKSMILKNNMHVIDDFLDVKNILYKLFLRMSSAVYFIYLEHYF